MINFSRFRLDNGLRVIVHKDSSTPLVAMNLLYDVGSRDEDPSLTGIAHLFEHLMYCGTKSIPEYDLPLQLAGGENNAFTSDDITNYYLTLPSGNAETAFWLESDRMLEPGFTRKKLDVQKRVVTEEFKQRYMNQPYGDAMLLLRPLAYTTHPYRWPTIGMDISHIENVTLEDARDFFLSHYTPGNAILALAGNIELEKAFELAAKWFGSIPPRTRKERFLPAEPIQTEERKLIVERDVPTHALYKTWHMGSRLSREYHTFDLLTDLLAGGESGRLHNRLVRERNLFSEINAYITSDIDPGLVAISGKLLRGTDIFKADDAVNEVIDELKDTDVSTYELEKVKNRFESSNVLSNTSILNKAMNLAVCELLGDPGIVNSEVADFRAVSGEMVRETATRFLTRENCSTLYYLSSGKEQK